MIQRDYKILQLALKLREENKLYDLSDPVSENVFHGSIERYTIIAKMLENRHRILDIGSGNGMLLALLSQLGHECYATDHADYSADYPVQYQKIHDFRISNVEIEELPYEDGFFDGVTCCQVLEHFTHSHLFAVKEMRRVLRDGGILEIDVPNVACLRNRSRLLRGKNITHDYRKKYLHAEPVLYKGRSFFPERHNREFTRAELELLFREAGFKDVTTYFLKSRRNRTGMQKIRNLGSAIKNSIPSLRKSIIGFGVR